MLLLDKPGYIWAACSLCLGTPGKGDVADVAARGTEVTQQEALQATIPAAERGTGVCQLFPLKWLRKRGD